MQDGGDQASSGPATAAPGYGVTPADGPPPGLDPPAGYGPPADYGSPAGYGPPPGYAPVPPGQPAYAGVQPTANEAIIALCAAIGSFVVLPLIAAIVALVFASRARDAIDASGGRLGGEGLVTAARIMAWVNIGLCALLALAVVAVFGLFATVGFS